MRKVRALEESQPERVETVSPTCQWWTARVGSDTRAEKAVVVAVDGAAVGHAP
ncbi:hypothetical protein ABH926_005608 [Catenulispora sp. GP43]|uniref:hypothetical protein n=1 Tax=Catenulispora sp. GP43 TaxID=3156263 RepID=UPI003511F2A7